MRRMQGENVRVCAKGKIVMQNGAKIFKSKVKIFHKFDS